MPTTPAKPVSVAHELQVLRANADGDAAAFRHRPAPPACAMISAPASSRTFAPVGSADTSVPGIRLVEPDERVHEQGLRAVVDVGRRSELLQPCPGRARRRGSAIDSASSWSCVTISVVMPETRSQPLDFDLHVQPQVLVERRKGLVEQQDRWLDRQCARQRHALLLAAGELPRQTFAHLREAGPDRAGAALSRRLCRRCRRRARPGHRPRSRRSSGAETAHSSGRRCRPRDVLGRSMSTISSPMMIRPCGLRDEARDDPQQRGLAAAGRAQQRDDFAALHVEIDVFHRAIAPPG